MKMKEPRTLFLSGNFKMQEVDFLIEKLFYLNQEDGPIILHINSGGGSFQGALNLYDAIKNSPNQVNAVVVGKAFSAAVVVLLACKNRYAYRNSRFLIHEIYYPGNYELRSNVNLKIFIEEIKKEFQEVEKDNEKLLRILEIDLKLNKEEISALLKQEKILDLEKARSLNIINC